MTARPRARASGSPATRGCWIHCPRARERTWAAGARPGRIIVDVDAAMIAAHSEKDNAAGTFKGGSGFHPLLAYLDETRKPLTGLLRAGNAGIDSGFAVNGARPEA